MTIIIQIYYITNGNNVLRRGEYKLKGKKPEELALDFWTWIKGEHPYHCEITKVIADGEEITEKVKDLEIK